MISIDALAPGRAFLPRLAACFSMVAALVVAGCGSGEGSSDGAGGSLASTATLGGGGGSQPQLAGAAQGAKASTARVSVLFDLSSRATSPFPSDRFTKPDFMQATFRRVALNKPDCASRPSDCEDIDVLNRLDGFNVQPRITVPFSGAIDVTSVNSNSVYLLCLGDTLSGRGFGQRVGINQIQWNPASNVLSFESDELLNQRSRYLLIVTSGVLDASGKPVVRGDFDRFGSLGNNLFRAADRELAEYRKSVMDAQNSSREPPARIVALSLFTTQSVTADLEKIHAAIGRSHPAPANFVLNGTRAVFSVADLIAIQFGRQTGAGATPSFTTGFLPTPALAAAGPSVARIAFGRFQSPDYQNASKVIPATPTLFGWPAPQGSNELLFQLFLPAGPKPPGGWPVIIYGHGFTDSMYGAPWTAASVFAAHGFATIAINVVGHGGGPLGTLTVLRNAQAPVVIPAGGRGYDQDGNGAIDSTEGVNALPPYTAVGSRDGLRQTVVDLMQLVRQIQVGMDVEGDGQVDLNGGRIYYTGQSFGGIYGTIFLGVESNVRAGVPNVPGGSIVEVARLGGFRILSALSLATRVPQLLNLPPTAELPIRFDENIPLRNQPPSVNTVPGSVAIQEAFENSEWVQQAGNPVAYAPYIRKQPLAGNGPKPVIFQFAKGDQTVPNPTTSAIIRAGDLEDRATYYRHDLAYQANPAVGKNPHVFLANIGSAAAAGYAIAGQIQIATFFLTDGAQTIDPDGAGPFFEVPIAGALPETLNYIP